MTLEEIKKLDEPYITPEQARDVIKIHPQTIRDQARRDPKMLGFPVCVSGNRTRIPRIPFIKFWEGS